jgi:hypothetical protein
MFPHGLLDFCTAAQCYPGGAIFQSSLMQGTTLGRTELGSVVRQNCKSPVFEFICQSAPTDGRYLLIETWIDVLRASLGEIAVGVLFDSS